ncbi:hypothetical protein Mal4_32280 [Maioricimonas rarisocia]|uniref:DUF5615 domain-containing protein n=1 Tax=Maioricimonas rarisocia TaxID=2528026 RepID=A0A517Z8W4_9PLAN|nr:DUF5615 family PIN-like protein [Maioricimonas rarisocia]QDU38896.1 hypothetical protein Mal4_32280 [Maioricimonas rarisocia]
MKLLVDMSLSPTWCDVLKSEGWNSLHWIDVGSSSAPDREIMEFPRIEGYVVFTHDLDFGSMLAATQAKGPSVVQVRTQDVRPASTAPILMPVLRQHEAELERGALLIIDPGRCRLRLLPLTGS